MMSINSEQFKLAVDAIRFEKSKYHKRGRGVDVHYMEPERIFDIVEKPDDWSEV